MLLRDQQTDQRQLQLHGRRQSQELHERRTQAHQNAFDSSEKLITLQNSGLKFDSTENQSGAEVFLAVAASTR